MPAEDALHGTVRRYSALFAGMEDVRVPVYAAHSVYPQARNPMRQRAYRQHITLVGMTHFHVPAAYPAYSGLTGDVRRPAIRYGTKSGRRSLSHRYGTSCFPQPILRIRGSQGTPPTIPSTTAHYRLQVISAGDAPGRTAFCAGHNPAEQAALPGTATPPALRSAANRRCGTDTKKSGLVQGRT